MRIAIMGTGAVGAYFGAKLAAASHDVAFIARGAHLEAMSKHGLTVKSYQGDLQVRDALFSADLEQIGTVDLVLFCVKSYDTDSVAPTLAPIVGTKTVILSMQNGIDNTEKIARHWGAARCLPGVVYVGASLAGPGVIEHSTGGRIIFGSRDGAPVTRRPAWSNRLLPQPKSPLKSAPTSAKCSGTNSCGMRRSVPSAV